MWEPKPAFTAIAPYYDLLMREVDYGAWARHLSRLMERCAERPVERVLEVGCGTGSMMRALSRLGYRVEGLDRSPQMLERARRKMPDAVLHLGDARSYGIEGTFDAIISVFDTLGNLTEPAHLLAALSEARRHLEPGGVFIFDLNTRWCFREFWGNGVRVREGRDILSVWRTRFREPGLSRLHITLFVRNGRGWRRVDEVHLQRAYDPQEVLDLLSRAGFRSFGALAHRRLEPPGPRELRVDYWAVR